MRKAGRIWIAAGLSIVPAVLVLGDLPMWYYFIIFCLAMGLDRYSRAEEKEKHKVD